jgi:hypothetical protein
MRRNNKRREEARRNTVSQIFHVLQDSINKTILTFNQSIFDGKRRVELHYLNNTTTGDHFIIQMASVRYMVRMKVNEHQIEARFQYFSHDKWVPGPGFAPDLTITTDGQTVFFIESGKQTAITAEGVVSKLLSAIAGA